MSNVNEPSRPMTIKPSRSYRSKINLLKKLNRKRPNPKLVKQSNKLKPKQKRSNELIEID